jgi:MinD-like ATPase involved in chromosome partitioning or flagellar assembly
MNMATATQELPKPQPNSRVIFTQGGKGGVGKTAFSTLLVEWFRAKRIPYTLLDLDSENKSRGSLAHYFRETKKINIHTPEGLDSFLDVLDGGAPLVIADMGAGSGDVAHKWFDAMYESAQEIGVVFTAIGVITPDPASVESVLRWAAALQARTEYLIVRNALTDPADFTYWNESKQAQQFREAFEPAEIMMEYRLPKVENPARQHGVTLAGVADRTTSLEELRSLTVVMRAQAYRRNLFAELDRVKGLLLL